MVTIDGEDAKDLDDAVSLNVCDGYYYLGVHIADVTNYVQENSALDREAKKRGTSVYLADRVIPMLPHTLSNGICSLNEGRDRLALSCLMKINEKGEIVDHEIVESVIRVDRRMTYTAVKRILEDGDEEQCRLYRDFVPMFQQMQTLSALLRAKRHRRGAVDFDFPETKVVLDETGCPIALKAYERNTATKLIEDFMADGERDRGRGITAHAKSRSYTGRIDKPDGDRMEATLMLIREQGIKVEKRSQ